MFPADPLVIGTLTRPGQLHERLGSFWRDYLADGDLLRFQTWAELQQHADVYLRSLAAEANGSIQTLQPFVERQWRLIRLLESALTQEPNKVQYGPGRIYGDGLVYGQISDHSYTWRLPEEIREVGIVLDDIVAPAHVYDVSNCSFDPVTRVLSFVRNPFDDLEPETVYDASGSAIDRQVLLWARNTLEDHGLPFLRYGAVLGLAAPVGGSDQQYCDVLRATWSILAQGPSLGALRAGFLASTGTPLCSGNETVELVATDDQHLCVVTDRTVYRGHLGATALVAVGDHLVAGQELFGTVRVYEFGTGAAKPWSLLPGLPLGRNLADTNGDLMFPNADETWVTVSGDVRFTVLGADADVAAFWAGVAERAVAAGTTLTALVGAAGTAVNPMRFVIENLLGSNLIVVTLKPNQFQGFYNGFLGRVRTLIPAGTLLLVVTELQATNDTLYLDGASLDVAEAYDASWAEDTGPTLTDDTIPCTVS